MIEVQLADLLKDLKTLELDMDRRLKNMVKGFMKEFILVVQSETPYGDSTKYRNLYLRRELETGLEPIEGFARSNWQISYTNAVVANEVYAPRMGFNIAMNDLSSYTLGRTIHLVNTGPYIGRLEHNYSTQTNGEGILKPSLERIMLTYKIDLVRYYQS